MDRLDYLLSLRETKPLEIKNTWAALGSLEVDSDTKSYIKDTIIKIGSKYTSKVKEVETTSGDFSFQLEKMLANPGSKLVLGMANIKEGDSLESSVWNFENIDGNKQVEIITKLSGHFIMKDSFTVHFQEKKMVIFEGTDISKVKVYSVLKSVENYIALKTFDGDEIHFNKISYEESVPSETSNEKDYNIPSTQLDHNVGKDVSKYIEEYLSEDGKEITLSMTNLPDTFISNTLTFMNTNGELFVKIESQKKEDETKKSATVPVSFREGAAITSGEGQINVYFVLESLVSDVAFVSMDGHVAHYEGFSKSNFEEEVDPNDLIEPGPLVGSLVYVVADYHHSNINPLINWESMKYNDLDETIISTVAGVVSPHFKLLLTSEQMASLDDIPIDESFVPFKNNARTIDSQFLIDDYELELILGELGVPFIRVDELEYTRDILVNNCVLPAVQLYYTFFPIIKEEAHGAVGPNQEFKVPYIKDAYSAVAYFTQGTGASMNNVGAFGFYAQNAISGGQYTGKFGNGLRYNKQVPGFAGLQYMDSYLMNRAAQQGYLNYHRREKILQRYVDEEGKVWAKGFSTIGGCVNIKWLCWNKDWNNIRFIDLNNVRKMATSFALRNIGMLRSQVKSDAPNNIDFSLFNQRADSLYDAVYKEWSTSSTNLNLATVRGGL